MATPRLTTALAQDLILPPGPVVALRPNPGAGLAALGQPLVVTGDYVAAEHWRAQGFAVAGEFNEAAVVLVQLTRAKAFARALIAEAAQKASALVLVDGQKTDGVDGVQRDLRKRVPGLSGLAKAHGRLLWFAPAPGALDDWRDPGPRPGPEGFYTQPGVFSEARVDPGSALLAAALPEDLRGVVADLGAGWGYLARAILARPDVRALHLVEAEARALTCAQLNTPDARAQFHHADATRWRPDAAVDAVVMNPPFHAGRAGDPALGQGFIAQAARILAPRGALWMVANRHLPYEATLAAHFAQVTELPGSAAFKLFHAARPRR